MRGVATGGLGTWLDCSRLTTCLQLQDLDYSHSMCMIHLWATVYNLESIDCNMKSSVITS